MTCVLAVTLRPSPKGIQWEKFWKGKNPISEGSDFLRNGKVLKKKTTSRCENLRMPLLGWNIKEDHIVILDLLIMALLKHGDMTNSSLSELQFFPFFG